jgi:uncharacterized membrane protein YkvA (DUF1232 family)
MPSWSTTTEAEREGTAVNLHTILIGVAITLGVYAAAVAVLFLVGRRTAAKEITLLLPNLVLLFKDLARDSRVSRGSKALLIFGALWFASPIDLIPEFIPILGPLDDAVVAALILRHLLRTAGGEVVAEHWRGDPATLDRLLRFSRPRTRGNTDTDPRSVPRS